MDDPDGSGTPWYLRAGDPDLRDLRPVGLDEETVGDAERAARFRNRPIEETLHWWLDPAAQRKRKSRDES